MGPLISPSFQWTIRRFTGMVTCVNTNMPEDEKVTVALPESLRRQFSDLQRRLFTLETLFACGFAAGSVLLGLFLTLVSDRLWDTPVWLRAFFFALSLAGVLAAALWWSRLWLFKPRDWRALAVLVQRKYRRLGDRLLGIVELSDEARHPHNFSPELYRAAIEQVADEAGKYRFAEAADRQRTRRQLAFSGALLGVVAISGAILPEAAWNSFRRWIAPIARIPRFTLIELAGLPHQQIVPHGEKFPLSGEVKYRSFWKPARVYMEFPNGQRLAAQARGGRFLFEVPPQTADTRALVRAGDTVAEVDLLARHRPAVEQAGATVELPAYLGYGPQSETAQSGLLEVLEGSSLVLTGRTSRPLQNAWLKVGEREAPITVASNVFTTPKLPADFLAEMSLRWTDQIGLTNIAPWKLAVQTKKDAPPLPQIEELYRDTAILETEVLPIPIRASDDYGLKNIGLSWSVEAAQEMTNAVARREYVQEIEGRETKYLEQTFNFSPAVLGLPPESTIEIHAFAVDYKPGRERSESPACRIHVLGNAQHAEMVRQNLESLLVQLEEVTRLQEKLTSETRELKDLQKLDTPEAAKKISELEQAQQQNSAQLQELASEGMKTMREALRNPAFDENVLSQWTKNLHQMEKVARQQMKAAAKSLKSAAQSQSASGREQDLAQAQEKEEETLKALQQMQQKVNQGLDDLQALTLSQRLRQLSGRQKKIESTLQTNIPDTIGLIPAALPSRYQRANSQLAGWQTETQNESTKLQGEISRFYERTQKPNYGEVTKEMADSRPADELERIRGLIQENIGMEAMHHLAQWADRFESWAAKLEPKSDSKDSSGAGSGEGGGGEKEDSALKQLLGLLRIREKQVNIQERTRLLHEHIGEKTAYRDGALLLAASQAKLGRDLSKQAVENPFAMLEGAYNDALMSMSDVENLLDRPQTDQTTRSAEDKSISMLSDLVNLLNEQAKKGGSSSSKKGQEQTAEQMAFLMQAMQQPSPGMKPGQNPGANMSGGTTDKAGQAATGNVAGKASDEREVKKSSSVPQNYPAEFREALQNYYKALEQSEGK